MLWTDYQQPQSAPYADSLLMFNSHSDNQISINHAMSNISISAVNGTCDSGLPFSIQPTNPSCTPLMGNMAPLHSQSIIVPSTSTSSTAALNANMYQTSFVSPPPSTQPSTATNTKMLPATFFDPLLLQQQQSLPQQLMQSPASYVPLQPSAQPYNSAFFTALSRQQQQQQHPAMQYSNHPVLQSNTKPGSLDAFAANQSKETGNRPTTPPVAVNNSISRNNDTDRREEGIKPSASQSVPFPVPSSSTSTSLITLTASASTRRGQRKKAALAVGSSTSSSSSEEKDDAEKRKNFLERNRQAALKCRQRKKQWLQSLQERVEFLANDNEQLHLQATVMRDEVLTLRNLLMAHKDCHFSEASKQAIMNTTNAKSTAVTATITQTDANGTMAITNADSASNLVTTNNLTTPHLVPAAAAAAAAAAASCVIHTPIVNNDLMIPVTNDFQHNLP